MDETIHLFFVSMSHYYDNLFVSLPTNVMNVKQYFMQMIKRRIIALSCILVTIKFYKKRNHLETETAQKKNAN